MPRRHHHHGIRDPASRLRSVRAESAFLARRNSSACSRSIADRSADDWLVWAGGLARNDELPGEPNTTGREFTAVDFLRRALQLVLNFADSLAESGDDGCPDTDILGNCI